VATDTPIVLVEYDPDWRRVFREEAARIEELLGLKQGRLQHIGSTAIRGIAAKPVVDLMLGCADVEAALSAYQQPLSLAGYTFVEAFRARFPGRLFFYRENEHGIRSCNLHIVVFGTRDWLRHLAFRDYLNAFPDVAKEYERLKFRLASEHSDTVSYSDAKSSWVQAVELRALAWRTDGWEEFR